METTIDKPRVRIKAKIAYLVLIYSVIGWGVAYWVYGIAHYVPFPQFEYTEGFLLFNTTQMINGTWSYNPATGPPYSVPWYPPVFYLMYMPLVAIFGESIIAGRILVLVCAVIGMYFVYLIVWHLTKNRLIAITAGLLPLTQPLFVSWSIISRVDVLAAMFEVIGVYLFIRSYKTKWLYLSAIVFIITFFTKQSIMAGAIACTLYLLFTDWRRGLKFGGLMAGMLVISLGTGWILTNGEFIKELFLYQRTLPTYKPKDQVVSLIIVTYLPLVPLMILAIWRFIKNKCDIISIYFAVAVIINLIMLGRHGGSTNYAVQIVFAVCLAGVLWLDYVLRNPKKLVLLWWFLTFFLLMGGVGFAPYPGNDYKTHYQEVKAIISDATYPILTENCGVVLDAGKQPYYEPFSFTQLTNFKYWDNSKLIDDLNNQKIEYIIAERPIPGDVMRYHPSLTGPIINNYRVIYICDRVDSHFRMVVYKARRLEN